MNDSLIGKLWRWVHGLSDDAMRLDRPDHMTRRFAQINATVFVTQQGLDPGYVPYVAALIVLFMEIERKERYGSSSVDSLS